MKKYKNKKIKISSVVLFMVVSALCLIQIDWNSFFSNADGLYKITEQVIKTDDGNRLKFIENKNTHHVTFVRKVDGDTAVFEMDGKEIKCRFLSVDTPEAVKPNSDIQYYGEQASDYTELRLSQAKTIYIEFDDNSNQVDKYGRMLAWIWVDSSLLQEDLIRYGYAKTAYMYGDYKYNDYLLQVEKQAEKEKIGVWET